MIGLVIVRTGMRPVGEVQWARTRGGWKWEEPTCPADILCSWLRFLSACQAPVVRAAANLAFVDAAMGAG